MPLASGALALALLFAGSGGPPRAAAEASPPALQPYTDVAVPAARVVMLGASTSEPGAPRGATWGLGEEGTSDTPELVRYTPPSGEEGGWEPGPALPAGFAPDQPEGRPSPLEGDVTPEGYGVLAGTTPQGETLLVRKPGGAFEATAPVPSEGESGEGKSGECNSAAGEEASLQPGQRLFGSTRAPMIAPLQEADGSSGALVVPVWAKNGVDEDVLHWDGQRWTCERIETESDSEFNVLAIAATSPENAWLLARLSAGSVALFRRVKASEGDGWSWEKVEVQVGAATQLPLGVPVSGGEEQFGVTSAEASEDSKITVESQLLTVTSEGVWVDGVRTHEEGDTQPYTTLYVRTPQGGGAVVAHSWCNAPAGAPACDATLPQEPPQEYGRSIAWANSSTSYGERVITGLAEGVMLRLNGGDGEFERVLSIGAEPGTQGGVPGQLYGAAFSSASEGWLGYQVPVHMTSVPEAERPGYWPLATRHPLLAVAPQPGAPVAALSSEAIAVGESGGVARYKPGLGWLPESLFGPSERIETPTLRAVAWPTPNRVYAVGAHGEMWLWRGETGLWERDPATPVNFRANLYGIAFDPAQPARGYAVGTQEVGAGGVLLRYGKTWTEEEETNLPAEVKGAQFTAVAFAGSEALVAFNLHHEGAFSGGLLVNDGGGWSVDSEEQQVTGSAEVQAVAALPDGGAAVLASKEGIARLYERESAGAPWRQEATPLPSGSTGSLALYRQNGALRALLSAGGAAALTTGVEFEPSPGSPPYLENEGALGGGAAVPGVGELLRQTATGWRDERHDDIPVKQGQDYDEYDEPADADPAVATLVSPSGAEAWTVGGIGSEDDEYLQTADVARYPAEQRPPNERTSQIEVASEEAGRVTTLAFGGGANCMAPCAERVDTGIGPQVWLHAAVSLAHGTGASAFFYTGPLVHYSQYNGQHPPAPPYGEEYARYAGLLGAALPWPAYAAGSEGELDGEAARAFAFGGLAAPLGAYPPSGDWEQAGSQPTVGEREHCNCADGYYAVKNGHVVVAMLDDGGEAGNVERAQREWLERELEEAGTQGKPVIVVGEADLGAQLAPTKHDAAAEALFAALTGRDPDGGDPGGYAASAYVYDAPEANVAKTISFGGASLPVLGSGTLGYEHVTNEETSEFHGQKGILLAEVQWGPGSAGGHDRVPVAARLIPVIEELGMESQGGTLLKRSEVTLFRGLARRPRAGCKSSSGQDLCEEGQYEQIPAVCIGATCGEALLPEYQFRSSRPDIGGFVKLNTAASNPLATRSASVSPNDVLLNAKGEPVHDGREEDGEQVGATSGLFCAYNAGETQVTISAGGLSYTLPVRVQAGSVRPPCGTVPLRELPPVKTQPVAPPPQPAPAPGAAAAPPASAPPALLPPPPPLPASVPARPPRAAVPPPFLPLAVAPAPLLAFVPPPVPTPARPSPPTGTSAVTSPVEMAEKEEEREEAPDSVSNKAVAYEQPEHDPSGEYVLGLVVLAALAGASIRRGSRGRRGVRVAPATLDTARERPRAARRGGRERW